MDQKQTLLKTTTNISFPLNPDTEAKHSYKKCEKRRKLSNRVCSKASVVENFGGILFLKANFEASWYNKIQLMLTSKVLKTFPYLHEPWHSTCFKVYMVLIWLIWFIFLRSPSQCFQRLPSKANPLTLKSVSSSTCWLWLWSIFVMEYTIAVDSRKLLIQVCAFYYSAIGTRLALKHC